MANKTKTIIAYKNIYLYRDLQEVYLYSGIVGHFRLVVNEAVA